MFGGLASEGIRRSVVCLTSKHLSLHPTAMALVVSVCVVPCAVLLCWIVFWAAKSRRSGSDGLHRYLFKRCLLSAMVIWYVTLVPVLKTALSVFLCVDVHDSADFAQVNATRMYWAVDTGMRCYEGDHWKLLYGVVVAFVCPVYGGLCRSRGPRRGGQSFSEDSWLISSALGSVYDGPASATSSCWISWTAVLLSSELRRELKRAVLWTTRSAPHWKSSEASMLLRSALLKCSRAARNGGLR